MTKRDKLRKQKACKHENYEYECTGSHERFYRCRDCGAWTTDRHLTNYWIGVDYSNLAESPV